LLSSPSRPAFPGLFVLACAALAAGLAPLSAAAPPPARPVVELAAPRLVRVPLDATLTLSRLLEGGFDVVETHGTRDALVLEWPDDEARLIALGARAELIDATPGRTLARRSFEDRALHPFAAPPARAAGAASPPPFAAGSMGGYWTIDEIKLKLDQLVATDTRGLVADKLDTLGYSVQGRPIWGLRIGSAVSGPDTRPVVFYNALTHAREPEGMQALFYFIDDILSRYGTDPWASYLLDQRVLYVVPLVNPDGYQINIDNYVNTGGVMFGMWRKNARDNDANNVINGNDGVDINRNYGYQWGRDNTGSSPTITAETYRGPAAFSEPETRAQRDAIIAEHLRRVVELERRVVEIELSSDMNLDGLIAIQRELLQLKGETLDRFTRGEIDGRTTMADLLVPIRALSDNVGDLLLHVRDNLETQARDEGRAVGDVWDEAAEKSSDDADA
jgi:hypothetical protein